MWIQKKNKNLSFFPPLLPTVQKQQQFKQHKLANLCKTMIIRKTCVFVAELLGFMLLHDDWTLTTKWDLCKKSIPTWSLDYREAIDTPTWSYLIGKNFFYVNQFGVCHAFLMNFRVFRPSPTTFIILARLNFTARGRGDIIVFVKGF